MKWWKRMLVGVAASLGFLSIGFVNGQQTVYASTYPTPTVYVDGELLRFDVQPLIYQYRTLVPLRMIFEAMGAGVTVDNTTHTVIATLNGTTLRMPLNSNRATVNGKVVYLDVPPMVINNRTMVPLRFISDTFGNQLAWNGQTCVAQITTANAPQVRVIGADRTILDGQAASVANEIQSKQVVQQVEQEAGFTYRHPVWMYVVNSTTGYQQAVSTYGSSNEADLVAQNSDGVAFGSHIVIPLNKQATANDRLMTVAHEMLHVLLNQNGGDALPSWVHEGVAWETGLDVSLSDDPAIIRAGWDGAMRDDVLRGLVRNQYQPLVNGMQDEITALSQAAYDLEYQDYLAYRYLVAKYGKDTFNLYLNRYTQGDSNAFANTFGMTDQAFEDQFHQYLVQESQKTDSGLQMTLNVPSGYKGSFSVLPQGTSVWKDIALAPGTDTIRIYKDGRVEGASVLSVTNDSNGPDPDTMYLFTTPQTPQMIQGAQISGGGAAVYDSFGQYVFSNVWLHDTADQITYPEGNQFLGITVVDVQAIP